MSSLPRYDWSRVIFAGEWTSEDAVAFARRVEEIADEEAAKAKEEAPDAS